MKMVAFTCCALATAHAVSAATISVECPKKFPADAIFFKGTPQGWTAFAPSELEVTSGELMYGPPSSYTYAVPATYRAGKRLEVGTWGASSTGQNWLQCGYGAAKELTLSQQLPPGLAECTIKKYKDPRGNVEQVSASCTVAPPLRKK